MHEKPIILFSKTHLNDKYTVNNRAAYPPIKYKPARMSETVHKQSLQIFYGNGTAVLIMNI